MKKATALFEIQQHLTENRFAVLYVQAPNCGVCTVFHKQVSTLLEQFPNIAGIETNIANVLEIASAYHVLTAPAVLFFVENKEVWRSARFIDMKSLQAVLEQYLLEYAEFSENLTA